MKKKLKIPVAVLERARAAVEQAPAKKPNPPVHASTRKPIAREKVIAALKKLHPMD